MATSKRPKILSDTFILQGVGEDAEDVTQTLTERAAKAKVASHSARRSLLAHASLVEEAHSIVQSKVIFADGSSLTEDVPVIETVEAKAAKSSLSDQTSFLEASQRDVSNFDYSLSRSLLVLACKVPLSARVRVWDCARGCCQGLTFVRTFTPPGSPKAKRSVEVRRHCVMFDCGVVS